MLPRITLSVLAVCACAYAADEMTIYELLPPETHQFAIVSDVTQTREGANFFLNPIRPGSTASKEKVIERSTGKELQFEVVTGKDAKAAGLAPARAADDALYLKVQLPGPVPKNGETRIRIFKTYTDAPSYYVNNNGDLIFDRPLGIKRNVVVLPAGWELIGSASPPIVSTQTNAPIGLTFLTHPHDPLPLQIPA